MRKAKVGMNELNDHMDKLLFRPPTQLERDLAVKMKMDIESSMLRSVSIMEAVLPTNDVVNIMFTVLTLLLVQCASHFKFKIEEIKFIMDEFEKDRHKSSRKHDISKRTCF